jgi:hypothetical protein
MPDNFQVTAGAGTIIRALDKSSQKTQVVSLDLGGTGTENLLTGALPVTMPLNAVVSGAIQAGAISAGAMAVNSQQDGHSATLGKTTDAAVSTDVNGTVQQYLRGLVKMVAAKITILIASGGVASGAIASGAVASGAVAASAIAAGAFAVGAITNGADVAEGLTTDAAASSVVAEDATARTGIGLWKAVKNLLMTINNKLVSGTIIGAVQDAGVSWVSVDGIAGVPFTSADQHLTAVNCTDAPTTSQKLVITDLIVSVDAAMSVTFKEETSGIVVVGPLYMAANAVVQLTPRSKIWKLGSINTHLQVITSVTGHIMVDAGYYSEV